jgi:ribosomal protein S18 acetylase RimI-like enzyme
MEEQSMSETRQGAPDAGELEVRAARAEDRDAVLAFCDRIGGEQDYIRWVWEDWLRETPEGRATTLVGVLDGRPVSIVHMRMLSEDEAWIEGIRVDPDVRRRGIARVLTSKAMVAARERGAAVVRLFVDASNVASQGLVARFGFTRVAEVVYYSAPALESEPREDIGAQFVTAGEVDFERIWAWLEQSNLTPFNGGVEIADWAARAVTEPVLRTHLASGAVWQLQGQGAIQALAIATGTAGADEGEGDDSTLEVHYLDGASEGIGRLALAMRHIAAKRGLAEVELWLPDLLILADAMAGAGYTRPEGDEVMYLYARQLQS